MDFDISKTENRPHPTMYLLFKEIFEVLSSTSLVFTFVLSFSLEFLAAISYEEKNVALCIASIGCFLTSQYPNILRILRIPSRRWQIFIAHFQLKDESIVLFNHQMDKIVCFRVDSICHHHIL